MHTKYIFNYSKIEIILKEKETQRIGVVETSLGLRFQ